MGLGILRTQVSVCLYIYIYIKRERERERERSCSNRGSNFSLYSKDDFVKERGEVNYDYLTESFMLLKTYFLNSTTKTTN